MISHPSFDALYNSPNLLTLYKQPLWDIANIEVDKNSILGRDLKFLIIFLQDNLAYDLVSGEFSTTVAGTFTREFNENGTIGTVNDGDRFTFDNIVHDIGTGPYTLATRYRWDGASLSWQTAFCIQGRDQGMYLPPSAANNYMAFDSTVGGVANWANIPVTSGQWDVFAYSVSGTGNTAPGYFNGSYVENSDAALVYTGGGTQGVRLFYGQTAEDASGSMEWCAGWNRELTATEHALVPSIFQYTLKPKSEYIPIDAVVGAFQSAWANNSNYII